MYKFKFKYLFLFISLFLTQIVQSVKYEAMPLENLNSLYTDVNLISFNYKIFSKNDCGKFLSRSKVINYDYQPIQISITNNTDKNLMFFLSNFNVKCIDSCEVAHNVKFSTAGRVIGWTIGGLILWPLFIPAIIEGIETPNANRELEIDFAKKSLTNQIINPFSTINGLVFISKKNTSDSFSFKLVDAQNNETFELSTDKPILKLQ